MRDDHEHAGGRGANATAASYVEIENAEGRPVHGVGMDPNIVPCLTLPLGSCGANL
jgi:2-isopropylmalate synthase